MGKKLKEYIDILNLNSIIEFGDGYGKYDKYIKFSNGILIQWGLVNISYTTG